MPDEAAWEATLDKARAIVKAKFRGMADRIDYDTLDPEHRSLEILPPGHVAISAETLLGLEAELNDVKATREALAVQAQRRLELDHRAVTLPGPGEPDLFKLETLLLQGYALPREAPAQLLAVVRECIQWRAAAAASKP